MKAKETSTWILSAESKESLLNDLEIIRKEIQKRDDSKGRARRLINVTDELTLADAVNLLAEKEFSSEVGLIMDTFIVRGRIHGMSAGEMYCKLYMECEPAIDVSMGTIVSRMREYNINRTSKFSKFFENTRWEDRPASEQQAIVSMAQEQSVQAAMYKYKLSNPRIDLELKKQNEFEKSNEEYESGLDGIRGKTYDSLDQTVAKTVRNYGVVLDFLTDVITNGASPEEAIKKFNTKIRTDVFCTKIGVFRINKELAPYYMDMTRNPCIPETLREASVTPVEAMDEWDNIVRTIEEEDVNGLVLSA